MSWTGTFNKAKFREILIPSSGLVIEDDDNDPMIGGVSLEM